jgi:hypothetical protein
LAARHFFIFFSFVLMGCFVAIANISRPVSFNIEEQRFEQEYVAVDPQSGETELRTKIVEDTEFRYITESSITQSQASLIIEDVSDQIIPEKLIYDTKYYYRPNSISVYLNGLNITTEISQVGPYSFSLSNEYTNLIHTNDKLLIVYFKLNG